MKSCSSGPFTPQAYGTTALMLTREHPTRRPRPGPRRASCAAGFLASQVAAVHAEPEMDALLPRAPRAEHLPRLARDEGGVAPAGAVQPVLPPAGPRRPREVDHVEGDGDPGRALREAAVPRLEGG